LTARPTEDSIAALTLGLASLPVARSTLQDASLDALCRAIPAAAALPLLVALAEGGVQRGVVLSYLPALSLRIDVEPVAQPAAAA